MVTLFIIVQLVHYLQNLQIYSMPPFAPPPTDPPSPLQSHYSFSHFSIPCSPFPIFTISSVTQASNKAAIQ
jgi:hypothetical protein